MTNKACAVMCVVLVRGSSVSTVTAQLFLILILIVS